MSGLNASLRFGSSPPSKSRRPSRSSVSGPSGGAGAATLPEVAAWQAECERVKDKLVITASADLTSSEWRPQLERALASLSNLQELAPAAQAEIEAGGAELAASAAALASSEQAAHSQLAGLRSQHKAAVMAVTTLEGEQAARQEYVATLEQELELEERQQDMTEQGNTMSDKRPVQRLAAACTELRAELLQMEVRTGVLQAMLLRQATAKT
ncbi:Intraflagellar transport protein 57 [Chlorella vulgaris]